jgi:hypothetical protein
MMPIMRMRCAILTIAYFISETFSTPTIIPDPGKISAVIPFLFFDGANQLGFAKGHRIR